MVDLILLNGVIGLLVIIATDNSQRLGDLLAGTIVITLKPQSYISNLRLNNHEVTYPKAINISDKDFSIIRKVLLSKKENKNQLVMQLMRKLDDVYNLELENYSIGELRKLAKDHKFLVLESFKKEGNGSFMEDNPDDVTEKFNGGSKLL